MNGIDRLSVNDRLEFFRLRDKQLDQLELRASGSKRVIFSSKDQSELSDLFCIAAYLDSLNL
jgi:hypothetical protein